MNNGAAEAAIKEFTAAVTLNSWIAPAYANRGLAYFSLGKKAESQKDFDRAISLDPAIKADIDEGIRVLQRRKQ